MSRLTDAFRIPKDISAGEVKISMTGGRELYIENYRGIVEYGREEILLMTKNGYVHITGENLEIAFYTNEDMKIVGSIKKVELDKEQST